jgi:hypothetical protein
MLGTIATPTDLQVNERVRHSRDPDLIGTVTEVEENRLSVMVLWDGDDIPSFQWSNKVERQ